MKLAVPRNIIFLSLGFFLIFWGFDGVQFFITTFFEQQRIASVGFTSLILIYLFFTLGNPLAAIIVSSIGGKKSMIIGAVLYSLFIFALTFQSIPILYVASILLGIGASLLWTGQNSYLVRASKEISRGANAGFFSIALSLGSVIGILLTGFFISHLSYLKSFLFAGILPIIGIVLLLRLEDVRGEKPENHIHVLKRAFTSKTALRLSTIWFSFFFILGLAIGLIPLQVKHLLGVQYVGLFSSFFYIAPILLAYTTGRISDKKGRKRMLLLAFLMSISGVIALYLYQIHLFLMLGIILLAGSYAIMQPIAYALVGDVSSERTLEYLAGLFWTAQNIGTVTALLISAHIAITSVYALSFMILVIVFVILLPLLRGNLADLKKQIAEEMKI